MSQLRHAVRSLRKSPVITAAAVLSLALGIGANAAIFSIFERLLLQPLPVERPDELVNFSNPGPKPGSQATTESGGMDEVFSYPMFRDLERSEAAGRVLDGLAAHVAIPANLALDGATLDGSAVLVSGSYFPTLGLRPAAGRLLSPDDDRNIGEQRVVVLAHDYWHHHLGGSRDVLGQTLYVNALPLEIVGVAPEGFRGTTVGVEPKAFIPVTLRKELYFNTDQFENRTAYWAYLFGRLGPGVDLDEARVALNASYRAIVQDVELPLQTGLSEETAQRFADKELALTSGPRGQSTTFEDVTTPILLLLAVTGFVLLIASANLANLMLVRAAGRSGEIAVRLALGASRRQVVMLLGLESLLVGLMGGLFGLLVARGTLRLLLHLLPAESGLGLGTELGTPAVAFLAALSILTGLVGVLPALSASAGNLAQRLRGRAGRGGESRSAGRLRSTLVTLEIALAMTLLVSAGLFLRSLTNVSRVELGLDTERLAIFQLSPQLNGYETAETLGLYDRIRREAAALPEVTDVTFARVSILGGSSWGSNVTVEGFEGGPDVDTNARFNAVGPDYFRTLGIPLLRGREITERDTAESPKVVVVNESFSRKFGLGREAVGRFMTQGGGDVELDMEIVGVVADAKYNEVKGEIPPMFFMPSTQAGLVGVNTFYVRSEGDPDRLLQPLQSIVQRMDRNLPVENLRTMEVQVRENVFLDHMLTTLSTAFAVLATLLAAIGLYGVIAYSVAQRTREMGLRAALGADRARIQRLILTQVGRMTLTGGILGLAAALALGRWMGSLLFGLEGHDPVVLMLAVLLLVVVAFTAGLAPAVKASRIDPMVALRAE